MHSLNEFRLGQDLKTILENWKGENVVEVRTILSHYIMNLNHLQRKKKMSLKLTGFFTGLEDVIESFLGVKIIKHSKL